MKASLTLREDPKNPILKAKIPLTIFGIPFCSGIEAGDYEELCISFSTAFCSGALLKFCYRPNDSCRPFGLTLRTGVKRFGSPCGSPISMSAEFSFTAGNSRPSFLLQFKPRSGDFSVRRSVESPLVNLSSPNYKSLLIQNDVVSAEKLSWNQLFSSAYGVLTGGKVCARTSVTVSRAVVKLGWSMRFPPPVAAAGGSSGGSGAEILLKELPYLVLRKIAIEHVTGDTSGKEKKRGSHGKRGDVGESRVWLKRELDLLKSNNLKLEMDSGGFSVSS